MTSDSTLQENVIDELAWDSMLEDTEIGVRASDGIVTLTGDAIRAAWSAPGVNRLEDNITVGL